MRLIPEAMQALWQSGGPFIGDDGAPHGRVTVEKNWTLTSTSNLTGTDTTKLPYRWWQRIDNSQVETEVPNIKSIQIDRSLDADAQSCNITMYNTTMNRNTVVGIPNQLGLPGAYTWNYGERDAAARWGQSASEWNNVLIPNALLRTYQGYGGRGKTITQALQDGNILLTGVWLVDEIRVGTDGMLSIKCRDMAKLLLDQQLFPPFSPSPSHYPLTYQRWNTNFFSSPAVPGYDQSNPVGSGPGAEGPKFIRDIAMSSDGAGYWVVGTDGGVFAFGVPYYGSRGGDTDNAPMAAIAADPLGHGYWLVAEDGGVFAFGQVAFYGSPVGITTGTVRAIAAQPDGRGYWISDIHGAVYAYGSAQYHGGSPVGITAIVRITATPSGNGYWLLDINGSVYAYGDAPYLGGPNTIGLGSNFAADLGCTPSGNGYFITTLNGHVYAYGDAQALAANNTFDSSILGDPVFGIAVTPTGNGYILVSGNGGIYSFGDAPFWGSLLAPFIYTQKVNGNYLDYVDIIKDLVLWSGWLAYDGTAVSVYGNLESTGAYSEDPIDPTLFDKRPVIDAINGIKEIVGYYVWIDEEGAFHFESPNWYSLGNMLETTGQRVETVYVIDEQLQLTDYLVSYTDSNVRSEIIISSSDPTASLADTVTTRQVITSDLLRGMIKPAMFINGFLTKLTEQQRMLETLLDHINFSLRQGSVTCQANPAIQINDQVRIYERQTSETFVHYVKGIQSNMDLDTGEWTTVITTFWLGEDWIINAQPALPSLVGETGTLPGSTALPPGTLPSVVPPRINGPTPPVSTGSGGSTSTSTLGPFTFDALGTGGTLYGPDTFPGTVSAPLGSPWTLYTESAGSATLVAGGVKLSTTGTGYFGRARIYLPSVYTDFIVTGTVTTPDTIHEMTFGIDLRLDPTTQNGYGVTANPGISNIGIYKQSSSGGFIEGGVANAPFTFVANTTYNIRAEVQGTTIRYYFGVAAFSGAYSLTFSDPDIASGLMGLSVNVGLAASTSFVTWNNIQVSGFGALAATTDPWVITTQGVGSAGAVVNGTLQLTTASVPGVEGYAYATLPTANVTDGAVSGTVVFQVNGMHGPSMWLRNQGNYSTGPHKGYCMVIEPVNGIVGVAKKDGIGSGPGAGAFTEINNVPFTPTPGVKYYWRFEVRGETLSAYVGTTPFVSTWTVQGDGGGTVPQAGNVELWNGDHGLGTSGGTPWLRFDDILIESYPQQTTGGGHPVTPAGKLKLGAVQGNDPSSPDHFGALIGADAPCGGTFQDLTNDPVPLLISSYTPWLLARSDRLLVITMEPVAGFGNDALHIANARATAQACQNAGIAGQVVLRPMQECNGTWFPWGAQIPGNESGALYKSLFRGIAQAAKAVAPDIRIAWNTQPGPHGTGITGAMASTADPELFYPGDDVVDIVTLSGYLWAFSTGDHSAEMVSRWTWARDWAATHSKYWAADEWACVATTSINGGDGNNPTSLIATLNFMRDNGCVYSWYFNLPDGNVDTTLDQLPACIQAFHDFALTLL